jgi:allantoin racemase
MRLLYLLVDEISPSPERVDRRLRQGQAAMPEGWSFDVRAIRIGPAYYEENVVGHAMAVPGILHAILTWQHEYDAVLIGCFGDPGLAAARAVAEIPIIGPAEAAFSLVRLTARHFGLIMLGGSALPDLDMYLSADPRSRGDLQTPGPPPGSPDGARCVGVETIGLPIGEVFGDTSRTTEQLLEAGRRLAARGAQAIVLGCMSFGFHPFADELQAKVGIEVIDPLRASIAALQAAQTLGVRLGPPPPVVERPEELREFLGRLEQSMAVSVGKEGRSSP